MTAWRLIAFPLILPWREEFWTLPLYFPHLEVGVALGWPAAMPYETRPLPPAAQRPLKELAHYRPGELTQQKAFEDFLSAQEEEVGEILRELKGLPPEEKPAPPKVEAQALTLAWQLEKLQADEEAQMTLVDRGHAWLAEILAPEPWEPQPQFGSVPGLKEMVDPGLARLRFALWQREMVGSSPQPWAPVLLSRTSRAIFGVLQGWPDWTQVVRETFILPGVKSEEEWRRQAEPPWQADFDAELEELLAAAAEGDEALAEQAETFREFLAEEVLPAWVGPQVSWDLEVWARSPGQEDFGPVLCWGGVNADILPGA
ncbi:MAG: hypothetical protein K6T55_00090 [Syntrophobacterales bacterium]|nr:hypothetical protein [Syntrophobacterales bacterium]